MMCPRILFLFKILNVLSVLFLNESSFQLVSCIVTLFGRHQYTLYISLKANVKAWQDGDKNRIIANFRKIK